MADSHRIGPRTLLVISFRYHVASLVAVLLALAAGVALGGGPLSELGPEPATAPAKADDAALSRERAFADELASAGSVRWYDDRLAGKSVLLVTFPGSSDAVRDAVAAQAEAAGGQVSGSYAILPSLLDPQEKTLVDTLGAQVMTQLRGDQISAGASTYPRIGELLGAALTTTADKGGKALSEESASVLQSLATAELVGETQAADGRASYVVVVLGADPGPDADPILAGLVEGLSAHSVGVVVAAPQGAGQLDRLRQGLVAARIATVDGIDRPAGEVTAVLALTEWPATRGGAFGASSADGAVGLG